MIRFIPFAAVLIASTAAFAGSGGGNDSGITVNVPEPASIAVLALGVAAVLGYRNRRK